MTTKDEALMLAMEAMEITGGFDVEINAIKEALAQPEQKPVAWLVGWVDDGGTVFWKDKPPADGADLYTTPPQRKPLTDEQWQVIADTLNCFITRTQKDIIESALGIKEKT